jgi:phosphoribosyl 1,2-cyclic phosphodiesterase
MEFALLCSGSKGNSFLVHDEDTYLLVDCGSTKRYLKSCFDTLGVKREDLDGVLITHDHSDHVSQIRHFADLSIYSPVEIPDIDTFRVRSMQKFTIGRITVTPIALSHDAPNTTGYILDNGEEKIVYITDTGYVNEKYNPLMEGADYIVLESNHDVDMLMHTRRPQYLKQRICGDQGHLNNEETAEILTHIVTPRTKMILLAHISQEANTRELALQTTRDALQESGTALNPQLVLAAAGQFEMIRKGKTNEEVDPGSVSCPAGMEYRP